MAGKDELTKTEKRAIEIARQNDGVIRFGYGTRTGTADELAGRQNAYLNKKSLARLVAMGLGTYTEDRWVKLND